ncbi:MAG: aldo/keto reductase [Eubacteriales bacterium]
MKTRILGKTGIKVTEIGFGALTIGPWQLNLKLKEGADIISYALEKGINFIDTAQYYKTYDYIDIALKRTSKEVIICTKSLETSYSGMKSAVEEARKSMNRDQLDIFLLHEVREGNDWLDRAGAWEYLMKAKSENLVKSIGISTHHVDVAGNSAAIDEIDILFPIINFKGLGIRNGAGIGTREQMAESILLNQSAGKGIFAMKVFGGGNLTSSYIEALDYIKSVEGIESIMMGFSNTNEIDNIFDYCDGKLDKNFIPINGNKKVRIDQGDCEGCGKCMERCPNEAIFMNSNGQAAIDHSKCLTCGYCSPVCPVFAIIMF